MQLPSYTNIYCKALSFAKYSFQNQQQFTGQSAKNDLNQFTVGKNLKISRSIIRSCFPFLRVGNEGRGVVKDMR